MSDNNNQQEKIAKSVTTIVLIGTCLFGLLGITIAIVAVCKSEYDEAKSILQILFSAILPLFGTWIGTILAFYFSKENLAAANQTVQHLVNSITSSNDKLKTIKAKDVMIPLDNLKKIDYKGESDDVNLKLKDNFLKFLDDEHISRVILLDEKKVAKYVLHRSIIEGFITEHSFKTGGKPSSELTFADLKADGNQRVKDVLKDGVKVVNEDANLSDAKTLIQNFPACNDVFITKSTVTDEPVLGWITDKTISENSII